MTAAESLEAVLQAGFRGEAPDLGTRRFLFVTGKGGVGKTTMSAALALAFAKTGKRVLVAMCNERERLSAVVGSPPIGDEIVELFPNFHAVNMSPKVAMIEYGAMVMKVRAVANAVFGNSYVTSFLRAVPGLQEWAMLGKAWYHTTEDAPGGRRFDVVLLDAPATGHGLDMLRVPKVILDVVPPGVLRRDAEYAWKMFQDPKEAGVVVVTLPEEMPTTETLELVAAVRELGLPTLCLVANKVLTPLFAQRERDELLRDSTLLAPDAAAKWSGNAAPKGDIALVAGARRARREVVQAESLTRLLASTDLPTVLLPDLLDAASTVEGTHTLAARLAHAKVAR